MSQETFEKGRAIRVQVLGEERVKAALDNADDFNRDFQRFMTEYCWGAGWGRDALDFRQRSLLNLGMLAALNRAPEFELHYRAAIKNGLTEAELKDAMIQISIYCGIPAGVEAFRIASKVNKELREAATGTKP